MFRTTRASHRLPRPDLDAQEPLAPRDNHRERQVSASDGSVWLVAKPQPVNRLQVLLHVYELHTI
jgi:hypothetical protein